MDPLAISYLVVLLSFILFGKGYKHYLIEPYSPGRNRWHYRQAKQFGESFRINKKPEICSQIHLI